MNIKAVSLLGTVAILLSACASEIQTTSGRDYLSKYPAAPSEIPAQTVAGKAGPGVKTESIDDKVRRIAAVEPILKFPARIGLARIANGELTNVPGEEAKAWYATAKKLGKDFGQFVPLSRMVAEMVTRHSRRTCGRNCYEQDANTRIHRTMEKIRLGAARQHMDAVLVYEVYGKSETSANILSGLDFTLIGAFILPGEDIEAVGFASALLVDVRNGYPYGTARKIVKWDSMAPSFASRSQSKKTRRVAETRAAVELAPEVEGMFRKLKKGLEKHVSDASPPTSSVTSGGMAGRPRLRQ